MEKYLVINAGSSSLKFSLYEMPTQELIVNGLIEKINEGDSAIVLKYDGKKEKTMYDVTNHDEAVELMIKTLLDNHFIENISEIKGIGHRVLHGAEIYSDSVIIDDEVLKNIEALTPFGPLHHPGEIAGIKSMQKMLPEVSNIAVFDTAFHQTIPMENYLYAVPYEWYLNYGVRKYGFHGTSYKYITEQMKEKYEKDGVNLIVCHIGGGASLCCIKEGKSLDTTMGLTPLDGLVMGTRSGNIDASIIDYVCQKENKSVNEITDILNKQSGLLGLTGRNDFRDLLKMIDEGSEMAQLAYNMYINRIAKYILDYYLQLNGEVDAIVFTAGVGENNPMMRADIINKVSNIFGIRLNNELNNQIGAGKEYSEGIISSNNSLLDVIVCPTDEECMILKDTYHLVNSYIKVKKI